LVSRRKYGLAEYGPVLPVLREMGELMKILNAVRTARGTIDFDLPEGDVVLDTDGSMVGVMPEARNVAHRLIEEFMIAANEAVAFELARREVPALYRVHTPPSPERLEELQELLATFGLILSVVAALLVLSGPLLGYGIGVAVLALILSLSGIHATGRRHVAGKKDAVIGMILSLAAIVVGVLALTGSLSWLGTDMQPVNSAREWLDTQFVNRFTG